MRWLDDRLRRGVRGRLQAEFPTALGDRALETHRVVWSQGVPVAHAMFTVVVAQAGARIPVGMIGLVYTEPSMRRRGLARACIEACVSELSHRGALLALLWSDRHAYYEQLGFHAAGTEVHYRINTRQCRAAGLLLEGPSARSKIRPMRTSDAAMLESLYAAKQARAVRPRGALASLAAAPGTRVLVAARGKRPVAYAALGRGDDFAGVIHEWAGEPRAVLACLEALCRGHDELGLLCGPLDEPPAKALREAGAAGYDGCFALARPLDVSALWRSTLGNEGIGVLRLETGAHDLTLHCQAGAISLGTAELLEFLFGREIPSRVQALLSPEELGAVRSRFPKPLYLWGFDSI